MHRVRAVSATILALAILGGLLAFTCAKPEELRHEVRAVAKAAKLHLACPRFSLL